MPSSSTTAPAVPFTDTGDRFWPLARTSLSRQAYEEIRAYLMRGRLKPGQRLVSRVLAAELGISTTPVREALWRLASEQALEVDARNTIVVPTLTAERYEEVRDLRVELEGMAAQRAAACIQRQQLDELADLHARHVAAEEDGNLSDALAHNEQFHFALCRASGLPTLMKIVETLWLQCGPLLNHFYGGSTDVWPRTEHPHLRVIDCLGRNDSEGAKAAIACDIVEGAKPILAKLQSGSSEL